jgi:hypothetical protein
VKEIKLSFDINLALKQFDVHWIEEQLLHLREGVFLDMLRKILCEIEAAAVESHNQCEVCGELLVRNGQEFKQIRTLVGGLRYGRIRLRCKRCGEEIYPLDRAIGLEARDGMTIGVRERALWAAAEVSYEKTNQFLAKFTGLEVSRNKIHTLAWDEGERITAWQESRREAVFGKGKSLSEEAREGPEVLYIQVDGTAVNDRESGEWMECRVGTSFSRRVNISKGRVWLKDKKTYASVEKADSFGEKFYIECLKQGVENARKVYFISDGAVWIKRLKEDYFPQAVGVLDIWHLERELKKALGEEKKETVEKLKLLALEGDAEGIVKRLMKEVPAADLVKAEKIFQAAEYVTNNVEWIGNIPKVKGYGSGPVEKTVDITVSRRFKKRGMSWYRHGVNPLLQLRLLKLNGEWNEYWNERKDEAARYAA